LNDPSASDHGSVNVAIVYFSGGGTTTRIAEEIVAGVKASGATAHLIPIIGADITEGRWANDGIAEQLDKCDGIIFGSPTYMGSVSGQMKSFMDAMAPRWFTGAWKDKVASAFTASSLSSGDKFNAFTGFSVFAMQMGMIWCGTAANLTTGLNPNGFYFGTGAVASTPEQITEVDLKSAHAQGIRVARLSITLAGRSD